jgi:broad specificity phosphatase PhoE
MLTLHMFRHGDTEASADGVFCGELDIPLAKSGLEQAERVGVRGAGLKPDALYVSPKIRAQQTMAPVARLTGLTPVVRDGLHEIAYGSWDGRSEKDVRASEPAAYSAWALDPALHPPPNGGENAFAISARAMHVLEEIRLAHPNQTVLLVSHKATIRVITCALLGLYVGRFRDRVSCPTASLTTFDFADRGPMLVRIGDTAHLE